MPGPGVLESAVERIAFYLLGLVILGSAIAVVSCRNLFRAALFLGLCLLSVAGVFLLMQAQFVAAAQVLIYAGAVVVLILFGVMVTQGILGTEQRQTTRAALLSLFTSAAVFVLLAWTALTSLPEIATRPNVDTSVEALAGSLLRNYAVPFEIASAVLLVAMIGAIMIARRDLPAEQGPAAAKATEGGPDVSAAAQRPHSAAPSSSQERS